MDTTTTFGEIEEIIDEVESKFNKFKNFDSTDHPPRDHRYYNMFDFKTSKFSVDSGSLQTSIQRELSHLEENIPDWIFVRSYKNRTDLMRAAVVGPPNTPYHHCLFFFDIEFPRNYPSKPPKVHYRSHGIDLNPNLHADGRVTLVALSKAKLVCLSFSKQEKWDPEESDLMRVFHAIRGALLSRLDSKNSRRVFVLACQKMIQDMREPPADFLDFVPGYFRKRAHSILMRFREDRYCDSVLMVDLFVRMFKVFERNGAYCKHHIGFLRTLEKIEGVDLKAKIRELESTQTDASTGTLDQEQRERFDSGGFRKMWFLDYL